MKIFLENVDLKSWTGPNTFAKKLINEFELLGHTITSVRPDIQLSFIRSKEILAPVVQRIDGIFFEKGTNIDAGNSSLKSLYKKASAVIIQSEFDKKIIDNFFGKRDGCFVINNGTDLDAIESIKPYDIECSGDIWCCSSRWTNRPNKRLKENINYFLSNSNKDDKMIVIGPDVNIEKNERIIVKGLLSWEECIAIYKRSKYFVHLAFVDHCPNVVIDAVACECFVICSSCSGVPEICNSDRSKVIVDYDWDFSSLVDVKNPPRFNGYEEVEAVYDRDINIKSVAKKYLDVFDRVLNGNK